MKVMLNECKTYDEICSLKELSTSNHMTGNKDFFCTLDENVKRVISFANKSKVPIMGKGDILLRLENGDHQFIS